jgi:hypothetical protein
VSTCACSGLLVVFPDVGHQGFGGKHQAGNRSGVLESETLFQSQFYFVRGLRGIESALLYPRQ